MIHHLFLKEKRKIKIKILTAILLGTLVLSEIPTKAAHASDISCQALLCLYGRVTHSGGKQSACTLATKAFFSIRIFTPIFNPILTAEARRKFLNSCSGAAENEMWVTAIIASYGGLFANPPW
ncbi:MAG: hypothetical protein J6P00_03435 [Acetobacter sp.]|nr:hypothetical protein [Acetobacter sp.]MBO6091253.1 hypothetical protein [Acetobacter sp.]